MAPIRLDDISVLDQPSLYRPPRHDLLRVPLLGRLLRARRGRLLLQLPLLLIALLLVYDGLTGPPLAAQNLATVTTWVHYRGLVLPALLLVGNLFCMGCPFTLPRTLALRLSGRGRRWPRALRNKWLAVAAFVGFLFLYEWLDLWAGPRLTAAVIIGYFIGAFVLEALFAESPFCKYICPLGTFNFISSTLSPTQITVRDRDVCRACPGKECVNGSPRALGCGTELFPPTLRSNLDCVFCLDCARACPYDNVALAARLPGAELTATAWPRRWDVSFLALVFAFAALGNAFGMVPPFYDLQAWLAGALGTANDGILLAITFATLMVLLPALAGLGAAWLSRVLAGRVASELAGEPLRVTFSRFAPAVVPLAVAIWLAHYSFHFAAGALGIVPVFQSFLLDHGLGLLGAPAWSLGPLLPGGWLLPLQTAVVLLGFGASLWVGTRIGNRDVADPVAARAALLPWLLLWLVLAAAALATFNLPMEMRGALGG